MITLNLPEMRLVIAAISNHMTGLRLSELSPTRQRLTKRLAEKICKVMEKEYEAEEKARKAKEKARRTKKVHKTK